MKTKVTFNLSAETVGEATGGILLGDFNEWNKNDGIPLKKKKEGSLSTVLLLKAGKCYQYRYLLNDGRWVNDHRTDFQIHPDNCVVSVPLKKTEIKTPAIPKKDDLTKIEGIGKKIAELLAAENIVSFSQLANTSVDTLTNILANAGNRFKIYNPSTWAQQAELAVSGNFDALKKLQKELKK